MLSYPHALFLNTPCPVLAFHKHQEHSNFKSSPTLQIDTDLSTLASHFTDCPFVAFLPDPQTFTVRQTHSKSQLLALSSLPFIHQLCPFENPSKLTVSTTQTVFPVSRAKPCAKVHPQITSYSLYNNAKEGIVNSMFKQ